MMQRYMVEAKLAGAHWAADDDRWQPVSIEERVILTGDPRGTLSFQIDRLVQHLDQPELVVLVDLKTASRLTRYWERQWPLSLQQKLYRYAVRRAHNLEVTAHYIEGALKNVPTELKYVELPDWSDAELEEAVECFMTLVQKDAAIVARAMREDGTVDVDTLTHLALTETEFNPFDCFSYGGECPVYRLCTAEPSLRSGLLNAEFEFVEPLYLQ